MTTLETVPHIKPRKENTFRHDVRAQIVNINCLARLVEDAVNDLTPSALPDTHKASNGTDNTNDPLLSIRNDVLPFIKLIVEASNNLDHIIQNESNVNRMQSPS